MRVWLVPLLSAAVLMGGSRSSSAADAGDAGTIGDSGEDGPGDAAGDTTGDDGGQPAPPCDGGTCSVVACDGDLCDTLQGRPTACAIAEPASAPGAVGALAAAAVASSLVIARRLRRGTSRPGRGGAPC